MSNDFDINLADKWEIINMLKEEEKIRYSKPIQEVYTEQYYLMESNPDVQRLNIELEIQKYILTKFGYSTSPNSINNYHKIPSRYFHDIDVKNSSFYIKLNIFQYPNVQVGDDIINAKLIDYTSKQYVNLVDLETNNKPLVILAGSMT